MGTSEWTLVRAAAVEPRDFFALDPSNVRLPYLPLRYQNDAARLAHARLGHSRITRIAFALRGTREFPRWAPSPAVQGARSQTKCRQCQQRRPDIDNYFAVIYDVHAKELLALLLYPGQQRPLAPVMSHIASNCADFDISVVARSRARLSVQLHERPTTRCARGYSLLEAACR